MSADPMEPAGDANVSQTVKALLGLRQMILGGELAAGTRVSELAVVERLGVSRTPVRAALVRLEQEGMLDTIPGGGFSVPAFNERDIHDAIELRGTLEGLGARLAAEHGASDAVLAEMRECVAAIDALLAPGELTLASFAAYVRENDRFHTLLIDAAGSDVVRRAIERAVRLPFASPNAFVDVQAQLPDARDVLRLAQEQHRAVVEAIGRREGTRAEALMREHARIAHRNLQSALRNRSILHQLPGGSLIRRRGARA